VAVATAPLPAFVPTLDDGAERRVVGPARSTDARTLSMPGSEHGDSRQYTPAVVHMSVG